MIPRKMKEEFLDERERTKPFIAIIGGRKAGKSTVVQMLTGCLDGG